MRETAKRTRHMTGLQFLNCVDLPENPVRKTRHRLPHWSQGETCLFVTFRLRDSIPQKKLSVWQAEREEWFAIHPTPWTECERNEYGKLFGARLDEWLDAGCGSCILDVPAVRSIVSDELLRSDGVAYALHAFVVMPNHVHVIFSPANLNDVPKILQAWKGRSAYAINRLLGKSGALCQREYWDRLVRDAGHLLRVVKYIRRNPVRLRRNDIPVFVRSGLWECLETARST